MNPRDVLEVSATIIASVGGGGAIVFGLSSYLGKVWAERGLAEQRQKYDQLNIAFSNQLDIATRRLQIELDALGHLHKLRTQSEFERLQELWKAISGLSFAFRSMPLYEGSGHVGEEFWKSLEESRSILRQQTLSIPRDIAELGNQIVESVQAGFIYHVEQANHSLVEETQSKVQQDVNKLEGLMRDHLRGENPTVTHPDS